MEEAVRIRWVQRVRVSVSDPHTLTMVCGSYAPNLASINPKRMTNDELGVDPDEWCSLSFMSGFAREAQLPIPIVDREASADEGVT